MSVITEHLNKISLGEAQVRHNLCMFPLLMEGDTEPAYKLLDEALEQKCARVTEVSESGSVPELKFTNDCDRPVLLMDGEELVGAKQNRILNLTVLAPAGKTIIIPVSCVEAGRWHARSAEFSAAGRAHFSRGRASKAAQVSESLRNSGTRHSAQSQVWDEISEKSLRMEVESSTSAAEDLYHANCASLNDYLTGFTAQEHQVGALFAINGEAVGFDLFDAASTMEKQLPKLIQSFALDAIDESRQQPKEHGQKVAESLLQAAGDSGIEQFPSVGEGDDLRLQGPGITGGGLLHNDRLIHLCVFRMPEQANGSGNTNNRITRASNRRRHWIH